MPKKFFTFSTLLLIFLGVFSREIFVVHAAAKCPFPYKIEATSDDVITKINSCVEARAKNTTKTISDFNCPAGDFSLSENRPLTYDLLAAHITTNILMNEVDVKMREYMQSLQSNRSKDITAWMAEYNSCIRSENNTASLQTFYNEICSFSYISNFLNTNSQKKTIISSSDAYPQTLCQSLADKKIQMWSQVGATLATSGVYKSYENDKDKFVEGVQGQYRAIIEKFHTYQKIIFRASSKITKYIREAVK